MDVGSGLAGRHGLLSTELLFLDAGLFSLSSGPEKTRCAVRKAQILREMRQLWILQGKMEVARHCESLMSEHAKQYPEVRSEDRVEVDADFVVGVDGVCGGGDAGSAEGRSGTNKEKEGKNETVGRSRLANVPAVTPDQVNDRKVQEKSCQLDRAYAQMETMTTPTSKEGRRFPRHNAVIITASECKPNTGGGNRTRAQSAEGKRRYRTVVTMRATECSMIADGTMKNAILAVVAKMNAAENDRTVSYWESLERQDAYEVGGIRFVASGTLSWKTHQRHVFGEEWKEASVKRKKDDNCAVGGRDVTKEKGIESGREGLNRLPGVPCYPQGIPSTIPTLFPLGIMSPTWAGPLSYPYRGSGVKDGEENVSEGTRRLEESDVTKTKKAPHNGE